jgi:alkylhydroperoxidase/carboxymuconolactone decarboxylase family protein YurZ
MALDERRRQLREEFVDARGYWNEFLGGLLELDPDFFEAYARFSSVPWESGPLEPKVKVLVLLAMDAAATHMYEPGVREHTRNAIALGATAEEIMEVLELTSTLGIHACNTGVPILMEELDAAGQLPSRELSERQLAIKGEFERNRGYWNSFWDDVLVLDPDFFEAYTQFSSVPWKSGPLEPKVKELIYTAFDVAATHMFAPGLRQHIRNALAYGATREEIMEVFELVSTLGVQACALGIPILLEESEAASA